jgi:glycosyltransferase involved in cell wall biosynthesis
MELKLRKKILNQTLKTHAAETGGWEVDRLSALEEAYVKFSYKGHLISAAIRGDLLTVGIDGIEMPVEKFAVLKEFLDEFKFDEMERLFKKPVERREPTDIPPVPPHWVVRGRKAFDPTVEAIYCIKKNRWRYYTRTSNILSVARLCEEKGIEEAAAALKLTKKTTREYYKLYRRFKDVIERKQEEKPAKKLVLELPKKEVIG